MPYLICDRTLGPTHRVGRGNTFAKTARARTPKRPLLAPRNCASDYPTRQFSIEVNFQPSDNRSRGRNMVVESYREYSDSAMLPRQHGCASIWMQPGKKVATCNQSTELFDFLACFVL